MKIMPCSRVGYVKNTGKQALKNDATKIETYQRDMKRLAEVWMDQYRDYVYRV